jgi:hypothetical protein
MNKKVKIILIIIVIITIGYFSYDFMVYGGARDIQSEESAYKFNSKDLLAEFNANSEVASKKYADKTIEITGIVTEKNEKFIILDNSIICEMQSPSKTEIKGKSITIKGRYVGFDDLLGELNLDQCNIIN